MALSPQELADRSEIMDTLIRYADAIDTKQFDRLTEVFTPDAEVDYTSSGGIRAQYPQIRKWLEAALGPFPRYLHSLSNTTFRIEGDIARTRTYFINPMLYPLEDGGEHTRKQYVQAAPAEDDCERTGGKHDRGPTPVAGVDERVERVLEDAALVGLHVERLREL